MLLRNPDPKNSLFDSTHIIRYYFSRYIIKSNIVTGSNSGKIMFVPKIKLNPAEHTISIEVKYYQFTVHFIFGITINMSQGQTLDKIDIRMSLFVLYFVWNIKIKHPTNWKIRTPEIIMCLNYWIYSIINRQSYLAILIALIAVYVY
ncbi:hypothetical protein PHYBLDRAFT_65758 [Phycomyces blakesleeanus NRRL 1555(-)]|uniref:ATP-dependent DNA helicase n=1 Tax=Phycomyces blakesleeanus (strain ATCC 8743b / DSM 1359 / FGSC 10004 / NBRC 33097 / NRRL 1555) TaxID=763407 RepID=A0A162PIF5_PHYB8|nr:hypothetical protein PHYBLDRAFT_65758 [Phycomyces blakesleeanus NRRL 1555(-)]OAD73157.1 hypothetical protein PHYBLDRAFT_65758 [Phycomyces blakesleeanus NRRL 1555(-)]|eukprot:XP_018291197.1 hypothetical protein PHYBLDRAFT_65758 [Phycomyces blakesleeanus NRRL 1555(-)]